MDHIPSTLLTEIEQDLEFITKIKAHKQSRSRRSYGYKTLSQEFMELAEENHILKRKISESAAQSDESPVLPVKKPNSPMEHTNSRAVKSNCYTDSPVDDSDIAQSQYGPYVFCLRNWPAPPTSDRTNSDISTLPQHSHRNIERVQYRSPHLLPPKLRNGEYTQQQPIVYNKQQRQVSAASSPSNPDARALNSVFRHNGVSQHLRGTANRAKSSKRFECDQRAQPSEEIKQWVDKQDAIYRADPRQAFSLTQDNYVPEKAEFEYIPQMKENRENRNTENNCISAESTGKLIQNEKVLIFSNIEEEYQTKMEEVKSEWLLGPNGELIGPMSTDIDTFAKDSFTASSFVEKPAGQEQHQREHFSAVTTDDEESSVFSAVDLKALDLQCRELKRQCVALVADRDRKNMF